MADIRLSWALEFLDNPADGLEFKFWAGRGDLSIDEGEGVFTVYKGLNGAVQIHAPSEKAGDGVRLVAELDATDPNVRRQLHRDIGPLRVRIRYLWYNASDTNPKYKLSGKEFHGRLSAPVLQGAVYRINVESMVSDMDRGRVVNWSHDVQQSRYPTDKGFEFLTDYANGIESKWPGT